MPKRVQISRKRGARIGDAVIVDRRTAWGNPYRGDATVAAAKYRALLWEQANADWPAFRAWIAPLMGHDLACWCKPGAPCHADALLHWTTELVAEVEALVAAGKWPVVLDRAIDLANRRLDDLGREAVQQQTAV